MSNINVTSHGQSGGITANTVTGSTVQSSTKVAIPTESNPRRITYWVVAIATVIAAIAGVVALLPHGVSHG
jgi:hypothetical protein